MNQQHHSEGASPGVDGGKRCCERCEYWTGDPSKTELLRCTNPGCPCHTPPPQGQCCPKCNYKGVAQDTPSISYFGAEYCGNPECECHLRGRQDGHQRTVKEEGRPIDETGYAGLDHPAPKEECHCETVGTVGKVHTLDCVFRLSPIDRRK